MRRDDYTGRFVYHGTRHPSAILSSDRIKCATMGDKHVSLTRSFDVAVYWATMDRDDDEGVGSVLVLDRSKLEKDLDHLVPFVSYEGAEDEQEEACMSDLVNLSRFLVAEVPIC